MAQQNPYASPTESFEQPKGVSRRVLLAIACTLVSGGGLLSFLVSYAIHEFIPRFEVFALNGTEILILSIACLFGSLMIAIVTKQPRMRLLALAGAIINFAVVCLLLLIVIALSNFAAG